MGRKLRQSNDGVGILVLLLSEDLSSTLSSECQIGTVLLFWL